VTEGLVKLMTHLDIGWVCEGVAHSLRTAVKQLTEPMKCCQDCVMSSGQSFYGLCLQLVAHSLTCSFLGMCHSSTHPLNVQVCHCMWSVLPGLPPH